MYYRKYKTKEIRINRMGKQNINDKEHILVCLSSAPSNPKIIQTAAAMAKQRRFPARIYGEFAQKYI